jgi:hypothetical protein
VTVTFSSGASAWIGSTHYVLLSLTVTLVRTSGEIETFAKTFGEKAGAADEAIVCTKVEQTPSGTRTQEIKAVAAP